MTFEMSDNSVLGPIVGAIQSGFLADAERLCRQRLDRVSGDTDVLLLLGLTLQRQGRVVEALVPYRRLTELEPDSAMHWGNYATSLRAAGDRAGAERAAEAAVRLAPDDADRLEQLGLLQFDAGRYTEARDTLLRATARKPDSPRLRIGAARACLACSDTRADGLLQPWRDWLPLDDAEQFELAEALSQSSDMRGAIFVLEDLLRRSPGIVSAQLSLARGYERINLVDEAAALLHQMVASGAAADDAVRREIARQNAQLAFRKRAYGAARSLLEQLGEENAADYAHYFALARVCDKLGDRDATMAALGTAHARQVEELRGYAAFLLEPDAPALPHADDRVDPADYRAWPTLKGPDALQSPVFVVGFPRSGTTLLEQMLDAHPRLQSMDERPFFNQLARRLEDVGVEVPGDLGKLRQRDCDELRKGYLLLACGKVQRNWDTRLVDKNPLNMLWLPMIRRMYPDARFIFVLRHPCDVIMSCYLQNFRAAPLVVACQSLTSLARAYAAAMDQWWYHVELIRPELLVLRYEDLVSDAPGQTSRIAAFLGLGSAGPMLEYAARAREKGFIATPSYSQVIEPVNTRSVGHWERYREHFESLLPILRPTLDRWGYGTSACDARKAV